LKVNVLVIETCQSIQNNFEGNITKLAKGRFVFALEGEDRKKASRGARDGKVPCMQKSEEIRGGKVVHKVRICWRQRY